MFRTLMRLTSKRKLVNSFCSTKTGIQLKNESSLYKKLSAEFDGVSHVTPILETDEVKHIKFEEWKARINILKYNGFTEDECFQIILQHPPVLKANTDELNNALHYWYSAQLGSDTVKSLILNKPFLLEVEAQEIQTRLPYLISLFKTKKPVSDLLLFAPNIMFDDWSYTVKKIDYIANVKGISKGEIAACEALTKSLDLIKLRFDVLEKCGVFKKSTIPYHKRNKYDSSKHRNPHLKYIVSLDDETFAKKIAKISTEEYQFCKDLFNEYEEENDNDGDNVDEDDDEDDDDDDDDYTSDEDEDYNNKK